MQAELMTLGNDVRAPNPAFPLPSSSACQSLIIRKKERKKRTRESFTWGIWRVCSYFPSLKMSYQRNRCASGHAMPALIWRAEQRTSIIHNELSIYSQHGHSKACRQPLQQHTIPLLPLPSPFPPFLSPVNTWWETQPMAGALPILERLWKGAMRAGRLEEGRWWEVGREDISFSFHSVSQDWF